MGIPRASVESWVIHGAIGGGAGGIVFGVYAMTFAALWDGTDALLTPLRRIGAVVLGAPALEPAFPAVVAASVGAMVHVAFAIFFGVVFAGLAGLRVAWRDSELSLPVSATIYGFLLWVLNFQLVAPAAGWTWLPGGSVPFAQLLAHAFGFGLVLGVYLERMLRFPHLDGARPDAGGPVRPAC
jgi:hypothetical protein